MNDDYYLGRTEGLSEGYDDGYKDGYSEAQKEYQARMDDEIELHKDKHEWELKDALEDKEKQIRDEFILKIEEYQEVIYRLRTEFKEMAEDYYTLRKENEAIQRLIKKDS